MCTIKFSIELNTFPIDDRDLTSNNICEKNALILKMDDASIVYTSFLDDSPVYHPPDKVLNILLSFIKTYCICNNISSLLNIYSMFTFKSLNS